MIIQHTDQLKCGCNSEHIMFVRLLEKNIKYYVFMRKNNNSNPRVIQFNVLKKEALVEEENGNMIEKYKLKDVRGYCVHGEIK